MMKELTGLDHNVEDRFGISLQDYSTIRYMTSMYMQTKDKKYYVIKIKQQVQQIKKVYTIALDT
jgi:hypothetical protein